MNKRITELGLIVGSQLAINDLFEIVDVSEKDANKKNKRIPAGEVVTYIKGELTGELGLDRPPKIILEPIEGLTSLLFTLPEPFQTVEAVFLYRNGVLLAEGSLRDFTITLSSPNIIITLATPTRVNEVYQLVYYAKTAGGVPINSEPSIVNPSGPSIDISGENGVTVDGTVVKLGAPLTENTVIDGNSTYAFELNDTTVTKITAKDQLFLEGKNHVLKFDNQGGIIFDYNPSGASGIKYGGDYSTNYENRSIPDVEWVLSQITSSAFIPASGLTNDGGFVNLGGTLTDDVNLNGSVQTDFNLFNVGTASIQANNEIALNGNIQVTDPRNIPLGIQYTGNYGDCFTNRSLPDVEWVNTQIDNSLLQAGNGLEKDMINNVADIGGVLTKDILLNINSFDVTFDNGSNFTINSDEFKYVTASVDFTSGGINTKLILLDNDYLIQDDRVISKGLEYAADYSSEFSLESLVSKRYVDSADSALNVDIQQNVADILDIDNNTNDLISLSGVPENTVNLGNFSGNVVIDNQTIKDTIQQLGDYLESNLASDGEAITVINGDVNLGGTFNDNITITGDGFSNFKLEAVRALDIDFKDLGTIRRKDVNGNQAFIHFPVVSLSGQSPMGINIDPTKITITPESGTSPDIEFGEGAHFERDEFTLNGSNVLIKSNRATKVLELKARNTGSLLITDNSFAQEGIKYATDYSATYTNRSLVDKGYIDTRLANQGALTAKDAGIVDSTYGAAEQAVIDNNRLRIEEIEAALQALGILS